MARNGKIARLPREIREQLNQRMQAGELGDTLLPWLNALPEVRAALQKWFAGVPISNQNLSEWRAGGFAEWEAQRETLDQAVEQMAGLDEMAALADGKLANRLANFLAVRFAIALAGWDGKPTLEFNRNLRALGELCQHVVRLRRGELQGAKLGLAQQREERERERTEVEVLEQFRRWADLPSVRQMLRDQIKVRKEQRRQIERMLSFDPDERPKRKDTGPKPHSESPDQTESD